MKPFLQYDKKKNRTSSFLHYLVQGVVKSLTCTFLTITSSPQYIFSPENYTNSWNIVEDSIPQDRSKNESFLTPEVEGKMPSV